MSAAELNSAAAQYHTALEDYHHRAADFALRAGDCSVPGRLPTDAQLAGTGFTAAICDKQPETAGRAPTASPSAPAVQPKLKVGAVSDPLEREADRVAEQVMRVPGSLSVSGKSRVEGNSAPAIVHDVLQSGGKPLDRATRSFFEPRFGHDFSRVRIHSDAQAATSARAIGALAYTVGNNVVFNADNYSPDSTAGRKLLAHELTHVVQQGGANAKAGPLEIGPARDAFEHEAHSVAETMGQKTHPAPSHKTPVRKRSSQAVQRYEAGEHAQFGETGEELRALAPKAFKYKVKPGETPKKLAQKFNITEDELKAANKDKLKKFQITKDPSSKVQGFIAGEEIMIPPVLNEAVKDALKVNELTFVVNGVSLEYGHGIALPDLFESPEEMLKAPPEELQAIIEQIKKEKAGAPVDDNKWNQITNGKYLEIAQANESHFAPSNAALAPVSGNSRADNKHEWEINHTKALYKSQGGNKDQALAINSYADHFLTDAFAAGHQFNKRDVMDDFEGKLPKVTTAGTTSFGPGAVTLFDTVAKRVFTGAVKTEFSPLRTAKCFFIDKSEDPGCTSKFSAHAHIDDAGRFSKLLQGIHLEKPEYFQNAIVKGIHDNLNRTGVEVENNKGDKWVIPGDKTLKSLGEKGGHNQTLEIGRKAVAQSQFNVLEVFKQITALNLPDLFKKVWDYVPHPTAAKGEKQVKDAVDTGTDPASAGLIDSAVNLISDKYHMIAEELVKLGKLIR